MMVTLTDAFVVANGKCAACHNKDLDANHLLKCAICRLVYHIFCPQIDPQSEPYQCTKSFLKTYYADSVRKPNFHWTCDPCTIGKDTAEKTDISQQVTRLTAQMETQTAQIETLATKVEDLVKIIPSVNPINQPIGATHGSPWANAGAVQKLRSSLLVKPHVTHGKPDITEITKVVVDNKLQVNNVGVSRTTGYTYINCPSEATRDVLKSKL